MVMNNSNEAPSRETMAFQPEKSVASSLLTFSNTAYEDATESIKVKMPKKILALTELLKEKNGYAAHFASEDERRLEKKAKRSKVEATTKDDLTVIKKSIESSEAFDLAEKEFEMLKLEVLELVDISSSIKLWLQLNVPRIEDGNNFGVSIQSDTVSELSRVEDSALLTVENWSKFLMIRAKMISKYYKHTTLAVQMAYAETLEALDEKQLRSVWIGWMDLRNNYAVIYDLIIKNIGKLTNPRSTNTSNMY